MPMPEVAVGLSFSLAALAGAGLVQEFLEEAQQVKSIPEVAVAGAGRHLPMDTLEVLELLLFVIRLGPEGKLTTWHITHS